LFIVMELCTGGELFDRIKAQGSYSEKDAAEVLRQMCEGINYLHKNKVAHCDLKPDNFLFLNSKADSPLKIIDFGMSKFVKRRKYFKVICGTPYYVAPEVIEGKYAEHCDMWSLGVVMFVMLFGYPPFYADQEKYGKLTDDKIFDLVKKGFDPTTKAGYGAHFPAAIAASASAKDLIAKLLNLNTANRLTAAEALEHPWLTGKTASDKPIVTKVLQNLHDFNNSNRFKQAVLSVMTTTLSEDDVAALKKSFTEMDENGDGEITVDELKRAMTKHSGLFKGELKSDEVQRILKMADVNGDGVLNFQELMMTCVSRKLQNKEERLWEAFCKLDLNGDGKITAEEIASVVEDKDKAAALIAEVDKNGDGVVDYDEFIQLWEFQSDKDKKKDDKKDDDDAD